MEPTTNDPELVARQYASQERLNLRIATHERYTVPAVDFTGWVLDRHPWRGDETVLDAGTGSGSYLTPLAARCRQVIAGDLSASMLRQIEGPAPRVQLDVQHLPLPAGAVDVVLANHMLYHVPDLPAALRQIARVLRPAGALLAATNSRDSMAAFARLASALGRPLGLDGRLGPWGRQLTFDLENGAEILAPFFAEVTRHDLASALVFDRPEPVVAYLGTMWDRLAPRLPEGITWEGVAAAITAYVDARIAADGAFRVNKLAGVFVCRGPRPAPGAGR